MFLGLIPMAFAGVVEAPLPAGMAAALAPRRVALVVGVDQYDDSTLNTLRFAAKDARDVEAALLDPALGQFDEVSVLTGVVSRDEFWSAFSEATDSLERDDTFLLYFAGHGTLDWIGAEEAQLFLMPSDAILSEARQSGIPLQGLENALSDLRSRRRVLVLDTCHSGQGRSVYSENVRLRGVPDLTSNVPVERYEARLYAAHYHQPALEDDSLENGVYTHYLLRGLRGEADGNGDGLIELLEAHWWAQNRTIQHTNGVQQPWVRITQVGSEWLYLAGERTRDPEQALIYASSHFGPTLSRGAPIEFQIDGAAREAGGIEPGSYSLRVLQGGEIRLDTDVSLAAGDRVDVSALLASSQHARAANWLLSGGLVSGPPSDVMVSHAATVQFWHQGVRRDRGRFSVGIRGDVGLGWHLLEDASLAGSWQVRPFVGQGQVGWWWGDRFSWGPTLGAGALLRQAVREDQNASGWQSGVVISPGTHMHWTTDSGIGLSLDGSLMAIQAYGSWQLQPVIASSVHVRFR